MIDADTEFGSDPIEIAPDLWWVGSRIEGDPFQCHAYLLHRGDQSVLFDPGSVLTWSETRRKIDQIAAFDDIRWFVVHHQDPDICGAMPEIDSQITRPDAAWVTHWRAAVLLKHYGPKVPFWLVDEHDWRLDIDGRVLEFIFTPYLHFPGAFVTFDSASGTLLSSDLFGGFSSDRKMFTAGLADFEGVRTFHEHYMPDHNILLNAMIKFEPLAIEMIAPQHGKIIVGDDIKTYITRLKNLDCGLYLMAHSNTDIQYLMTLNNLLRDTIETVASEREFRVIADHVFSQIAEIMPVLSTELICRVGDDRALWLSSSDRFRGTAIDLPSGFRDLDVGEDAWSDDDTAKSIAGGLPVELHDQDLALPMFRTDDSGFLGLVLMQMAKDFEMTAELSDVLRRISRPMGISVEREIFDRMLDEERTILYERSIRDPLTGLFSRRYLDESAGRLIKLHRRNPEAGFAILMADIDHFKTVNDDYGHLVGDEVLRDVAGVLRFICRESDIAARFGGEEFVVLMPLTSIEDATAMAERLRGSVRRHRSATDSHPISVTISLGVAIHRPAETLEDTVRKADLALFEAKKTGRDQVRVIDD